MIVRTIEDIKVHDKVISKVKMRTIKNKIKIPNTLVGIINC